MATKGVAGKSEVADVKTLYVQAACELFRGADPFTISIQRANALSNLKFWSPALKTDLEVILKCLGKDGVSKASKVIALFEKSLITDGLEDCSIIAISGALANVAKNDPESFDSAVDRVANVSKNDLIEALNLAAALDNGSRLRKGKD